MTGGEGIQGKVARAMSHLQRHMPDLGMRSSKVEVIPAVPASAFDDALIATHSGTPKPTGSWHIRNHGAIL